MNLGTTATPSLTSHNTLSTTDSSRNTYCTTSSKYQTSNQLIRAYQLGGVAKNYPLTQSTHACLAHNIATRGSAGARCKESEGGSVAPPVYGDGGTQATHRGCHKFIPRHKDEIFIEIGDPIFVKHEHDDLWCEGTDPTGRSELDACSPHLVPFKLVSH